MRRLHLLTYLVVLAAGSLELWAEDGNTPNQPPPQTLAANPLYNLNPPGARSMGMGATFIGIADDATAAEANPAGLTSLSTPELSINFRYAEIDTPTLRPNSGFFEDESTSFEDSTVGPSFFSYTRPLPSKNAAFSIYYQQAANFESHEEFLDDFPFEGINRFDFLYEHLGFSAAWRIAERVSIGASVRYSRASLDFTNRSIAPLSSLDEFLVIEESIDDSDENFTYNVGVLFNPNGKVSAGIVFKSGEDFTFSARQRLALLFPSLGLEFSVEDTPNAELTIPDSLGVGLAYRPSSRWTIGIDAVRVSYSDTTGRFGGDLSDETEIHLGLEYAFTLGAKLTPFFIRAGFYENPDHDGTDLIDSEQEYLTLGAGVFIDNSFQLDGAIAISDDNTETLVSLVWRL